MTLIERLQDNDKCMDAVEDAINRIIILESRLAESSEAWQTLNNENCHLKTELAEKDVRMKPDYYAGKGCQCEARCESDCGCDVDWTPVEVYELRERLAEKEGELAMATELVHGTYECPFIYNGEEIGDGCENCVEVQPTSEQEIKCWRLYLAKEIALSPNASLEDGMSTEMLAKVTENEEGELG